MNMVDLDLNRPCVLEKEKSKGMVITYYYTLSLSTQTLQISFLQKKNFFQNNTYLKSTLKTPIRSKLAHPVLSTYRETLVGTPL